MSIIKIARKKNPYVMLDKTCLMDLRLSWRAKGLHAYIMGLPDEWDIRVSHLVKQSTEGRDALYKTLNELKAYGYITQEEIRQESGKFSGYDYVCYETPQCTSIDQQASGQSFDDYPHANDAFSVSENSNISDFHEDSTDFEPLPENPDTVNQPLPEKPYPVKPTLVINKSNNNQVNKLITAAIGKADNQEHAHTLEPTPVSFAAADLFLNAQNAHPPAPSQTHTPQSSTLSGIDTQIDHALGLTTAQKDQVHRRLAACGKDNLASAVMHCLLDRSTYTRSGLDFAHKLNVIMKQIRDNQFAYVSSSQPKQKSTQPVSSAAHAIAPVPSNAHPIDQRDELLAGIAQWENMARLASDDTKQSLNKMIENARAALSRFTAFSSHTFSPTTT